LEWSSNELLEEAQKWDDFQELSENLKELSNDISDLPDLLREAADDLEEMEELKRREQTE
jgi:septal ring factor EnvC (AmiA/AmiB activator)